MDRSDVSITERDPRGLSLSKCLHEIRIRGLRRQDLLVYAIQVRFSSLEAAAGLLVHRGLSLCEYGRSREKKRTERGQNVFGCHARILACEGVRGIRQLNGQRAAPWPKDGLSGQHACRTRLARLVDAE